MLKKTDPWYVAPPAPADAATKRRYDRALRLAAMPRFIELFKDVPRYAAAVAYRRDCLARWQDYLDGKIDPPTGRKTHRSEP